MPAQLKSLSILLYMPQAVLEREAAILRNNSVKGHVAWSKGLRKVGFLAVKEESSIKASAGDGTIDLEKKQTSLVGENRRSRKS